jgi:uncharacterized protein (DUF362 family)
MSEKKASHLHVGQGFSPATPLTRRAFVATVGATLAAACRARPYDSSVFVPPAHSPVAVLPAASYAADLTDVVRRGLQLVGLDVAGRSVLLKPNLIEYEQGTVINTHPLLVASAAEALLEAGAREVVVAEGPGHRRDIEYLVTSTGLFDYLRSLKLRFVDLNHDDVRRVALKSRFSGLGEIALPASLLEADIVVSMPKLKTHHWAGLTCSLKNLFGAVPGAVYGWPKNVLHVHGITECILDLAATIQPALAIVDGIVGMEGDGPIMGSPRQLGVVVMGRDPVAVDATCARLIGVNPWQVHYLREAAAFLGNVDHRRIPQVAEPISRFHVPFELIPQFSGLRG